MKRNWLFLLIILCTITRTNAQLLHSKKEYTRADTLRGSLRPERTHYNVLKYNLSVKVEPEKKYISGNNKISFKVLKKLSVMQLDLFEKMNIDSIVFRGKKLEYQREFNAVFVRFSKPLKKGNRARLDFYYSGHPTVAKTPPWDGGFIFTHDKEGNPWISVAVQGTGASLWYPNKDTQNDEPDEGAEIHIAAPNGLMDVSNGRLTGHEDLGNGYTRWDWKVVNPINNYNIILNIGKYVHFSDKFRDLDLSYYVLPYNLEKAKKQFEQVKPMMKCFYDKFGEYPFVKDSYKLVETPYLGMEHQSAVGYGNHYENGYLGKDLSGTGIGLKWDYIIIHESGHEWFGNSITAADIADMWIHEAFTSYAESIYIECRWGKKEGLKYLMGTRKTMVHNDRPIIGDYGVNKEGSGDMYFKGANMLNTLRSVIDNDEKWWNIFRAYVATYKHKIIDTATVVQFFSKKSGKNLTPIFDQYLRYTAIPKIEFQQRGTKIAYRWQTDVKNFKMPLDVFIQGKRKRLHPTNSWQTLPREVKNRSAIKVDLDHFYVKVEKNSGTDNGK